MRRDDDLALVRRARSDRDAFDALFDRYVDRVHRLSRRHSRSDRDAEALTEELLAWVFSGLEDYGGTLPLDAWVLSRCRSALALRVAKERRRRGWALPQGV